jgi:hypothetical protein
MPAGCWLPFLAARHAGSQPPVAEARAAARLP